MLARVLQLQTLVTCRLVLLTWHFQHDGLKPVTDSSTAGCGQSSLPDFQPVKSVLEEGTQRVRGFLACLTNSKASSSGLTVPAPEKGPELGRPCGTSSDAPLPCEKRRGVFLSPLIGTRELSRCYKGIDIAIQSAYLEGRCTDCGPASKKVPVSGSLPRT